MDLYVIFTQRYEKLDDGSYTYSTLHDMYGPFLGMEAAQDNAHTLIKRLKSQGVKDIVVFTKKVQEMK